jgi:threonine dehydrogenase-like Zn-dependent dehydrogenase
MSDCAVMVMAPRVVEVTSWPRRSDGLGPNEVEGRTCASLVSPGTELNWYYDPVSASDHQYPVLPGYAAVFEVERTGHAVTGLVPGDLVLDPSGRHASWQRSNADLLVPVPVGLSPTAATFARLMAVSMATLSTTAARPPEAVGVSGLGLIGHLAAKIMSAAGYTVTAWDSDEHRRTLLDVRGIQVVDRAPVPDGHLLDDPDVSGPLSMVIECRGNAAAVLESSGSVRRGGEVVLVGVPWRRSSEVAAHDLLRVVFHRYATIRSGWEYQVPDLPTEFRGASTRANLDAALQWLASGRVTVDGLAETILPQAAARTYDAMYTRSWPALSAIFDWSAV